MTTPRYHRRTRDAWARHLAGSTSSLAQARQILDALATIADPGDLVRDAVREARELVREFEADVDDVMEHALEDGYNADDFS